MKIANLGGPTSPQYRMWSRGIRFFLAGMVTLMAGTNIFDNKTALLVIFILGIVQLAIQSIDVGAGQSPEVVIGQQEERVEKAEAKADMKVIKAANGE